MSCDLCRPVQSLSSATRKSRLLEVDAFTHANASPIRHSSRQHADFSVAYPAATRRINLLALAEEIPPIRNGARPPFTGRSSSQHACPERNPTTRHRRRHGRCARIARGHAQRGGGRCRISCARRRRGRGRIGALPFSRRDPPVPTQEAAGTTS
jgi:hypothetical protein